MRYALQKPCEHCPFRNDRGRPFFLNRDRAAEILIGMDYRVFPCHKTAVFDDDLGQVVHEKTQACAGALSMMEHGGVYSAIVQVGLRLGEINLDHLDLSQPVHLSPDEFLEDHPGSCEDQMYRSWW